MLRPAAVDVARSAAQGVRSHRLNAQEVRSHRLNDLDKWVRGERYRDAIAATWRVRRKNRLTTARRLGCEVQILHFTGATLQEGKQYIFNTCGELTVGYIASLRENLSSSTDGHIWAAVDANGLSRGYVMGKQTKVDGVPVMKVDVLCSGAHAWDVNTGRGGCQNVGIHLLHRVEKDARRAGLDIVYLQAVKSAVRFYARLGYKLTQYPCKFQADKHQQYDARSMAEFRRSSLGARLARYYHGKETLTNASLKGLAMYRGRIPLGNLLVMTKCLRNI